MTINSNNVSFFLFITKIYQYLTITNLIVLSQYNKKNLPHETVKPASKADLKSFIVDDSDLEEIEEVDEDEESIANKKKESNKNNFKHEDEVVTLSSDDEKSESSDGDLYGKDLQLFYIKTTNKLTNETNKK